VPLLDLVAACDVLGNRAEADAYVARILTKHDAEVEEDLPPRTAAILRRRSRGTDGAQPPPAICLYSSQHCQGGWWGFGAVRRGLCLQLEADHRRRRTSANDGERRGLATTVAPRGGCLTNAMGRPTHDDSRTRRLPIWRLPGIIRAERGIRRTHDRSPSATGPGPPPSADFRPCR
jgi:hypothetical protein